MTGQQSPITLHDEIPSPPSEITSANRHKHSNIEYGNMLYKKSSSNEKKNHLESAKKLLFLFLSL